MKTMVLASFSALALLASCSVSKVENSEVKIINGRPVAATSPAFTSAVRLDLGGGLCTGSVISPKIILTAAHCLQGVDPESITVTFDRVSTGNPARFGRVAQAKTFKSFGADRFPNFDVAYLELQNEVPAPYAPIEILRDASSLSSATPILLAGYGNQVDDCQSESCVGSLRETNTRFKTYYDKAHILSLLVFQGGENLGLGGACNGDSGGPAYAQIGDKWYLIGVTNGLRGDIVPEADGTCKSGWDIYTFAGDYAPWIERENSLSLKKDSATNRDPSIIPQVRAGVLNKAKPNSWEDWVNFANHEDSAWYTVDSVLQDLIRFEAERGGITSALQMTEMLYNASRTESAAASIKTLQLSGESIGDLSPLASFVSLQQLYLDGTSVKDLSPLSNKGGLSVLGIRNVPGDARLDYFNSLGNSSSSVQVLSVENVPAELINAIDWTSFVSLNQVSFEKADGVIDLSKVKPSASAKLTLALGSSDVEGVLGSAPSKANFLQLQNIHSVDGRDLKGLVNWDNFSELTDLDLRGFGSAELPDLSTFAWLKNIGLSANSLDTLKDLSLPLGLENLDVSGNKLSKLDLELSGVVALRAYDNPLIDTACPAGRCELDTYISPRSFAEFCENAVNAQRNRYQHGYYATLNALQTGLTGNSRLNCRLLQQVVPSARYLPLNGAGIRDIRPIAYLTQVQYVVLDNNEIIDLSPILGLTKLQYLSAGNNLIREVPSFKGFIGLQEVNLIGNPIESLTVDGPAITQVAFGKDSGLRVRKNFDLAISDAPELQNVIFGGVELSEASKAELHNAFALRAVQIFDAQPVSSKDYSDMLSLQLFAPNLDLSEGCAIINGICISENEEGITVGASGPTLGTLSGSRVDLDSKGAGINLPGLPFAVQAK